VPISGDDDYHLSSVWTATNTETVSAAALDVAVAVPGRRIGLLDSVEILSSPPRPVRGLEVHADRGLTTSVGLPISVPRLDE